MDTKQTKPIILKVPAFEDFRGYLAVPYDKSVDFKICQINQGYSKKAFTLRGLHFQEGEHAQAKLVSDCGSASSAPGVGVVTAGHTQSPRPSRHRL